MAYVNCSISSTNINAGQSTVVSIDGCADAGDSWFMYFALANGAILWSTFANYYYQQCFAVAGTEPFSNAGYYAIYGYAYTGDAPRSQQVRTSATVYLTVNSTWQYVNVPNPLGLRRNTVDIRGLYEHRHDDTAKRADVGIRYGGTDISNYFQPGGNGYDSGFRSGNSSLGSLFA